MEPGALLVLAKEAAGAAWQEAAAKEQCAPVLSLLSSGDMLVASMSRAAAVSPMAEDDAAAAEVVHRQPLPACGNGLRSRSMVLHLVGTIAVFCECFR